MRRQLILLMLIPIFGLGTVDVALAITNGQPDGDNHPYVGLIRFDDESGPGWRCSGSLIAPDIVLTAGHCTDGAVAARVWFVERLQDEYGNYLVPDYPGGGKVAIEGIPYTFSHRDVGVVVLSESVPINVVGEYAALPDAGLVDNLKNKTAIDLVGYGVQDQISGGGLRPQDRWTGLRNRLYAPSELVSGKFVHSDEYMRIALNPGGGSGGICFGDSGGPNLLVLNGKNIVLAVNSYVNNANCRGVGYSSRVDIPEVLEWIEGFMP
jgi:hypothetical protein